MAKLPVTLTICIAFLNLSSANKFGARIRGGDEAKIEDYPYQVALWYNGQWGKCGGSIISPNWILTAAHCVFLCNTTDVTEYNWIGRGGPINWPERSLDLAPLDFFLWGHVKDEVC
ncbi:unnamed protein product [Acanthoscelides obtectus]|uniref:Peptidase S1 domain-containing protein n=1 Tax=Acanthoscelides obtectus TaxID=200917 RepID=A0A9P0P0N7_ACAOB|nr:unnamed protein product [Acanthoscelides obtectus]CAK1634248.1 Kallikrein-15 [Acanthoscelides obtectus]